MYKCIGTDFDGTLLTDTKKVSKRTKETLKEVRKKKIIVVGVTGRTLESVKNVISPDYFDYLILNNGANIYDIKRNHLIRDISISKETAKEITTLTEEVSHQLDYCTFSSYHLYKNFKDKGLPFIKEVKAVEEVKEPISKINIFLKKGTNIQIVQKKLKEKYKDLEILIMQDSGDDRKWIVITPNRLNKKKSLEYLGKELGISLQEMIFFGDGLNDLEVIEAVGLGVAMGNALEEVKKKSKDLTITNNEDGVAYYMETIIRKEEYDT